MYFIISGIVCVVASFFLLIPDTVKAIQNKETKVSKEFLITKSLYLIVQTNYSMAIYAEYGYEAAIFLWVGLSSQVICTLILIGTKNCNAEDNEERLPLLKIHIIK